MSAGFRGNFAKSTSLEESFCNAEYCVLSVSNELQVVEGRDEHGRHPIPQHRVGDCGSWSPKMKFKLTKKVTEIPLAVLYRSPN